MIRDVEPGSALAAVPPEWLEWLRRRRPAEPDVPEVAIDPVVPSRAFLEFLRQVGKQENPTLVDLGPVVPGNLEFFAEGLGCRVCIEDVFRDWDEHVRAGREQAFAKFLETRFTQADGSAAGILCWDLLDYLDAPAAQTLAREMTRLLCTEGAMLVFLSTVLSPEARHAKFVISEDLSLRERPYPAARGKLRVLENREITRLFGELRITDSYLLRTHQRQLLFRKPGYLDASGAAGGAGGGA